MATRHLSDLYRRGESLTLGDNEEEKVEVWVEKLRAFHAAKAVRAANAERAKRFAVLRDEDGEDYLSILSAGYDKTDDQLIEDIAGQDLALKYQALEAELKAEKEWSESNYIQGLQDAWIEGLDRIYLDNPEDVEAKRVYDEFERFSAELTKRYDKEKEDILAPLRLDSTEELRKQWMKIQIENDANEVWFVEYKKQELLYAIRDPKDHKKMYFGTRSEIDDLDVGIVGKLVASYNSLNVDVSEGKDSQSTQPSSPSSDSVESPETVEESGPSAATP